jgi:hypothetical protein
MSLDSWMTGAMTSQRACKLRRGSTLQSERGSKSAELQNIVGPTSNNDWIILLDDERRGQLNAAAMEVTDSRTTRTVDRIWWIGR